MESDSHPYRIRVYIDHCDEDIFEDCWYFDEAIFTQEELIEEIERFAARLQQPGREKA